MVTGRTETGFDFEIDELVADDFELLENLIALDKGEWQVLPEIVRAVLGEEQKKRLYEFCRNPETKRVSTRKVAQSIKEIFTSIDTLKK